MLDPHGTHGVRNPGVFQGKALCPGVNPGPDAPPWIPVPGADDIISVDAIFWNPHGQPSLSLTVRSDTLGEPRAPMRPGVRRSHPRPHSLASTDAHSVGVPLELLHAERVHAG